jgi:hypothetical protein
MVGVDEKGIREYIRHKKELQAQEEQITLDFD